MKYVVIRCEDLGIPSRETAPLLEGAKTAHLQQLAQAGAAGLGKLGAPKHHGVIDRLRLHQALLGLDTSQPGTAPGGWYAAAAGVSLEPGETAWCCDLVTQHDGRITDPGAGRIPTKESELLIQALDERLGSDTRRWEVGHSSHHVLVVRDEPANIPVPSPELLIGEPWERHLPDNRGGGSLRALLEQGAKILEQHPVNRVRADLGENPANMLWLWGASDAGRPRSFADHTGFSGAVVSSSFLLRGLAKTLGLGWKDAPASFEERSLKPLANTVLGLLERHDFVYVHLGIASNRPVDRLVAMERVDQLLLKPLTERLPQSGAWRLLAVVDDRVHGTTPFVAIGTGLPQQPAVSLSAENFAESPLAFKDGPGWFSWFTQQS